MKVCQVNGSERPHILWPVKYSAKDGANLNFLTCKLLQGNRIKSDHKNNIMTQSFNGEIILDHGMNTHDG